MKKYFYLNLVIICLVISFKPLLVAKEANSHPFVQIQQDPLLFAKLEQMIQAAVLQNFGKPTDFSEPVEEVWQNSMPLFVTAKKDGKVRGCMGTLQSQQTNFVEEIRINLQKAFAQDPRHTPIAWEEIPGMEIYLSAIGQAQAVADISQINPLKDAVWIKNGAKQAVVLAGETKTQSYLEKFARAKAGLDNHESIQVYRLETITLKIKLRKNL